MERYSAGEDAAFGEVYDHVAPRLYAFAWRQVRDSALAEDVVQQSMLQMHRARGAFIPGAEVMPWAFAIARRLLIDRHRKNRTDVLSDHVGEDTLLRVASECDRPDVQFDATELVRAFSRALGQLPKSQQAAFALVEDRGLSIAEAARVLGVTVNAVKVRTHRARVALEAIQRALGGSGETG